MWAYLTVLVLFLYVVTGESTGSRPFFILDRLFFFYFSCLAFYRIIPGVVVRLLCKCTTHICSSLWHLTSFR